MYEYVHIDVHINSFTWTAHFDAVRHRTNYLSIVGSGDWMRAVKLLRVYGGCLGAKRR